MAHPFRIIRLGYKFKLHLGGTMKTTKPHPFAPIAVFSEWTMVERLLHSKTINVAVLHLRGQPSRLNTKGLLYELRVFPQTPTLWQWEVICCGSRGRDIQVKAGTTISFSLAKKQCRRGFQKRHENAEILKPLRCALGSWVGSINGHDQGRDYTQAERAYLDRTTPKGKKRRRPRTHT
jgi:hypothetical protein